MSLKVRLGRSMSARKLSSSRMVGSLAWAIMRSSPSISALLGLVGAVHLGQQLGGGAAGLDLLQLGAQVLRLQRALDVGEALPEEEHLADVELLALDEDLLAHADLAEVVEEARVADLLELVPGEAARP